MKIQLFDKQFEAFKQEKPINCYIGGIQCGKTTWGALRMFASMCKYTSEDDNFIVAAPNYKILSQATLPKLRKFIGKNGTYNKVDAEFRLSTGARCFVRTATNPESMEGITNVRRVWIDEAGLVSLYFFENAMGRAAFREAPIDLTTTPYSMNWLCKLVKDAKEGKRDDTAVTELLSIDSPYFPKAEFERQKKLLDARRFKMKYMGAFGEMEGLVFDIINVCEPTALPAGTKYYAGVDWGYIDPFALMILAKTPDNRLFLVDEFVKTHQTIEDMVRVAKQKMAVYKIEHFYCDPSEPGYIDSFCRHGLPASAAENDIRLGIDLMYAQIKSENFFVFEPYCQHFLSERSMYHYPEEKDKKPDEPLREKEVLPVDNSNHTIDATRYAIVSILGFSGEKRAPVSPASRAQMPSDMEKRLKWLKAGGSSRFGGI